MLAATTDIRLFLFRRLARHRAALRQQVYFTKAASMWQTVREGWTRVSTNMAENITGMRVVTAFDRQVPNLGVFNRLQTNNTNNNVHDVRINGVYQPVLDLIRFVGKTIILVYGGYLIVAGRFPPGKGVGAVVAASLYWDWFMNPITTFGQWYNMLMQAMAGAERVFSLARSSARCAGHCPTPPPLPRIVGRVQFEHVTFGYDPARPVCTTSTSKPSRARPSPSSAPPEAAKVRSSP